MKKNLLIILLVALAAVVGWFSTYFLSAHHVRPFRTNEQIMEWLQHEYQLTPTQYAAIKELQEGFRPLIQAKITELRHKRDLLKNLEDNPLTKPKEIKQAQADVRTTKESVHELLKAHVEKVAALMSPEQSARYLKKMAEHHLH